MKTRKVTITVTGRTTDEILAQLTKARKYVKNGNLEAYDYTEVEQGVSYHVETDLKPGKIEVPLPKSMRKPKNNWLDDNIQFPRLIAEAEAAGAFPERVAFAMADSMDLQIGDVYAIVNRAQDKWEKIKAATCPPSRG
jgi:hypothetical protein